MQLVVNGENRDFAGGSIQALLESLSIDPRRVAVELNLDIVPKGEYGTTMLKEGDRIEIVQFVGGGANPRFRSEN